MSWNVLTLDLQTLMVSVLTEKQLDAIKLELSGMSQRDAAIHLDVSRASFRDRLDAAYKRLRAAGVVQDASGNWYLKED